MDVTFYVFLGFLVGVTVMCAMVIAVSVKDNDRRHQPRKSHPDPIDNNYNKVVYKKERVDHYTYNASGKKRKVRNIKYRD